jgi:hypothetical protein
LVALFCRAPINNIVSNVMVNVMEMEDYYYHEEEDDFYDTKGNTYEF